MAGGRPAPHPRPVPPSRPDYAQMALPDVLPEAERLPSEVVLDGGLLSQRRREALGALRALLVDRPEDIAPDEWRVAVAHLAPPAAHLGRAPGSAAGRYSQAQAARECFPGLSLSAAVARLREVLRRPHVARFVADLRALEMLDVLDQRGTVREALHATLSGAGLLHDPNLRANPSEWARVSACVTAASKVLMDLDALALRPEDVAKHEAPAEETDAETDSRAAEALAAKVGRVAADLGKRRRVVEAEAV